ncbi:hypothetical protein HK097_000782 [Rhizophlyctis rosea]|uniref:Cation-transporting P-type ATPase N-terminal domain-containing protein n=1 Tax=Rhizophlyctis rosea TaxID=64517 RepID=A0AAD5SHB2_9FUNG|nr:hypothetical protein HK097_000782 [Rhizophlyctis rosea]
MSVSASHLSHPLQEDSQPTNESIPDVNNSSVQSNPPASTRQTRPPGSSALFAPYSTNAHKTKKSPAEIEAENAKAERTRLAAMAIAADVRERLVKRSSSFTGMKETKGADRKAAATSPTNSDASTSHQKADVGLPTIPVVDAAEEVKKIEQMAAVDRKAQMKSDINEHHLPLTVLTTRLSTSVNPRAPSTSAGLSRDAASSKLNDAGLNVISPPKKRLPIWKFLQCLASLFNVLLGAAGFGYFIMYAVNPHDYFENIPIGCILIAVAFVNAGIEFYELQKIAAILGSFTNFIPPQADVIRSSTLTTILAKDIVPGDVVYLRNGSRVPADAILFHALDCKVDASTLTGENEPIGKWPVENGAGPDVEAFEAPNVVFNGSTVVTGMCPFIFKRNSVSSPENAIGEAYCVVIRTGDKTVLGRIAQLTKHEKKRRSPLSNEIHRFCHTISVLASLTAFVFFVIALIRRGNFNYALTFGIGIIIAWIPQGLALTITMLLTISARRMADRSVLVKDLHGVETLGAVTMLATDKTGTITANAMTVTYLWTNGTMFFAGPSGAKACPPGERPLKVDASGVAQILHMSATCTRARFDRTDVKPPERCGWDATEQGLLRFAALKLVNIDRVPSLYPKVFELPFSSETRFHLTIHRKGHATGGLTLHIKGSPESIWAACSTVWKDGKAVSISDADRKEFENAHADMCGKGHRVLAFAMLQLPGQKYPDNWRFDKEKQNFPKTDLTFVGLVSLEDGPKAGVREAVGQLRIAGIKVSMITGDHPLTAEAVARRVNIITTPTPLRAMTPDHLPIRAPHNLGSSANAVIITGSLLPHLSPSDWFNLLKYDELVFARTSPTQKLEIVTYAQHQGHIVGVTGDGVNDAAALKKADLGIAMNKTGSDVSKESAGMILLDDEFATIVKGVLEAVDLGFEIFNALSFAFEPPEDADLLMRLPPRRPVDAHPGRLTDIEAGIDVDLNIGDDEDEEDEGEEDGGVREQTLNDGTEPPTNVPLQIATLTDSRMLMSRLVDDEADMLLQDLHRAAVDPSALTPEQKAIEARLRHRYTRYISEVKTMVTQPAYWRAQYRQWSDLARAGFRAGERLVDGEVMSWAYLEGGMIECIGALVAFFAVLGSYGLSLADAVRIMKDNGKQAFLPHGPAATLSNGEILVGIAREMNCDITS